MALSTLISGTVEVGEEKVVVAEGQSAWLDQTTDKGESIITFKGGQKGGRFVFYAGEPQGVPIVSHGPFIGDTNEDIIRLYGEYRQGKMRHVRELEESQLIHHG
jgi:redox-sensitive bicupin YhaK (pirin superfamily)